MISINKILSSVRTIVLLFTVLGVLIYGNTLSNNLLWDDDDNIVRNIYIKDFRYVPNLFTENQIAGAGFKSNQYRPILLLSYSIEYHLINLNPFFYHLTNMVLQIINSILVWYVIKKIVTEIKPGSSSWIAFITATLFLIHPVQTEAVAYIAGRTDLLGTMFILLGIATFLKNRIRTLTKAVLLSTLYICGILSKESVLIFPVVIATTYTFIRISKTQKEKNSTDLELVFVTFPLLIIAVTYIVLRLTLLNFVNTLNVYGYENILTESIIIRIYTFLSTLPEYLTIFVFPLHLHTERFLSPSVSLIEKNTFIGLCIVICSIATAFIWRKRNPLITYGIAWFFITIFLTSNIPFPVNAILTEHWLYTPSIGIFLILSVLITAICIRIKSKKYLYRAFLVIILSMSIALAIRTSIRNYDWKDQITLYEHTIKYNKNSARIYNNLAMAYAEKGLSDKALKNYQNAVTISDQYPQTHHNIANIYIEKGESDKAIEEYKKALSIDPTFIFSYKPLIDLLNKKGKQTEINKYKEMYQKIQMGYR